jgi:hypothetical protein
MWTYVRKPPSRFDLAKKALRTKLIETNRAGTMLINKVKDQVSSSDSPIASPIRSIRNALAKTASSRAHFKNNNRHVKDEEEEDTEDEVYVAPEDIHRMPYQFVDYGEEWKKTLETSISKPTDGRPCLVRERSFKAYNKDETINAFQAQNETSVRVLRSPAA